MNALAIKGFVLALLASVLLFGGCRWQARVDESKIQHAKDLSSLKSDALRAASRSFKAFGTTFRAISAQTDAEAAKRKAMLAAGEKAAREAAIDRANAVKQRAKLRAQLEAERVKCVDGERPICGIPLR